MARDINKLAKRHNAASMQSLHPGINLFDFV